ncbi:MAG: hypothetical protein E7207_05440 [Clostridium butyricum]|nr:hypothetical protein [Clostridium butyricum]
MGSICKVSKEDLKYAVEKINYWYKKNIKNLTITTVPFNTSCIFSNIIDCLAKSDCRILYVWGKSNENKELVTAIREFNSEITHSYIKKDTSKYQLSFVHYKNLENVKGNYELVIFDDITYFSHLNVLQIREYLEVCNKIGKRVILYSIEKVGVIGEKFELAAYNYKLPFAEPRLLSTRIDLNEDIPYSVYDYLKWFRDNNDKVAIYVPNEEKVKIIFDYFQNKLKLSNVKVLRAISNDEIKRCDRVSKYKDKSIFIITNRFEELMESCYIDNIVVLFSDDNKFSYKSILYICGQIRNINCNSPEILLVSNNVSENMEKAKDMAREFNKKVWEKRLLTLKE